jgi:uncharacterized protein YdeI (YjbR/CyaY-like superfamily)
MRTKHTNVADLVEDMKPWVKEVTLLREIALSAGLDEGIKWGVPVYMKDGKNVMGIGAFKSYVGIWFYQGVFLSDPKKVLINAQEGKTKALRQWRFTSYEDIQPTLVKKYIKEAAKLVKEGKELKPQKKKSIAIPTEFVTAFKNDKRLKNGFEKLTPGKQREYLEHVAEAKAEPTRIRRVEKCIPIILSGKGLHDKYK